MAQIRDRIDPPKILINSYHGFLNLTGAMSYDIFQETPSQIFWDTDYKYNIIDLNNWTEKEVSYNQVMINKEKPRVPYIYIHLDRSVEKSDWRVEFVGKFRDQLRLNVSGNGGMLPSGFQSRTVKVFSGDINLFVRAEKIFSQHVENLSGGIVVKVYPSIGLISMEHHIENISKSLYFMKIQPFNYVFDNQNRNENLVGGIVGYPK
jgi:hypothetical protein